MNKPENKKAIFVIGPPASGKGTQAKLIVEKTGYYHFITSKEGKAYIEAHRDDPWTAKQEELYKKGELFEPEWLVKKVQMERSREIFDGGAKGVVYDGSPRTLYEAENFVSFLADLIGGENVLIINIEVSEEELAKRTGERLVCGKNENHVESTRLSKFKVGDQCPKCGEGTLQKRDLDNVLGVRVSEYKNRTAPGIEYLKNNHNVVSINGEQTVEDVFAEIVSKAGF